MIHPKEIPPEAILLAVYLELQNGKEFFPPPLTGVCFFLFEIGTLPCLNILPIRVI